MEHICTKFVAMLLVIAMIAGVLPFAFAANVGPFTDVKDTDWFASNVQYVYDNGLMNGTTTTTFEPESNLTRAQTAMVLWRIAGQPAPTAKAPFTDLVDAWYRDAIAWAAEQKVVNGRGDGTFDPAGFITREELVTMTWRYAGEAASEQDLSNWPDADKVYDYAAGAMKWAVETGVINGKDGKLAPKDNATRAQFAAIIERYMKLNDTKADDIVILYTNDVHANITGGSSKAPTLTYEQVAWYRNNLQTPYSLLVDAGDAIQGEAISTLTHGEAIVEVMNAAGYDYATFGNHEFDYRARGLAEMLNAAVESGDPVPPIVQANYKPPAEDVDTWAAWNRYGIGDYLILERGGVRYGIFGLMGEEADSNAPMSGMEFEPIADAAERTVAALEEAGADFIICLSHSGTDDRGKGEDYELARRVDGIDVILSGHTHTTLDEPLRVGDTLIVSCGEYTANLGVLTVEWKPNGEKTVADYRLLPVDETVAEDPDMAAMAAAFQPLVEEQYLSQYGVGFDEVLARSPFAFTPIGQFGAEHREDTLGSLIADSYVYAVQQAEGADYVPVDFAVVAAGVIRGSFPAGEITTSDVFNVSSLGSGADGTPGYPLISVWLTGKELKDAFEVDASVTALMPEAQIYGAGMTWTWNPHRMMFNKVTDCAQVLPDGSAVPIDDDRLYRVVTGLYTGQMLGTVNDQSFGILAITPKDAQGNVITDYEEHIIYNPNGSEVKEWYALASYLQSMGEVDGRYAAPEGRKVEHATWNPLSLLNNLNLFGWLAVLAEVLVLAAVVFLVWRLCFHHRRGRYGGRRRGGGYRPYRG